jgi:hypothetical protein
VFEQQLIAALALRGRAVVHGSVVIGRGRVPDASLGLS